MQLGISTFTPNSIHMKTTAVLFAAILLSGSATFANHSVEPVNSGKKEIFSKKIAGNFRRVQAHRQQQGVGLSWTVLSTQGILGFVIERSYDGIYFEEVGEAVCESSGRHRFNDAAVYPGYLHYRIVAVMEDGSTETSETIVLRIVSRK
jgi:hypothetical protein